MKKLLNLSLLFALGLFSPLSANAETALSYGILDTEKVFVESEIGKKGFESIQNLQQKAEAELALLENRINALDISQEDKDMYLQLELQGAVYTLQGAIDANQEAVVGTIEKTLEDAMNQVRKEKNLPIILAAETVLSYDKEADITVDVINAMNAIDQALPPAPQISLPAPKPIEKKEAEAEKK